MLSAEATDPPPYAIRGDSSSHLVDPQQTSTDGNSSVTLADPPPSEIEGDSSVGTGNGKYNHFLTNFYSYIVHFHA